VILQRHRELALALRGALVGAAGILVVANLPAGFPVIAQAGVLLSVWLFVGSLLLAYAARHSARSQSSRSQPSRSPRTPSIPLRFSGSMGRFRLRPRGDGRHVEIVSEGVVLAEVKATDLQDQIEFREAVPSEDVEDLGSALGQAIELASHADEAHLDWDDHGASEDWTDQPASKAW
jgi:hypothetical protein